MASKKPNQEVEIKDFNGVIKNSKQTNRFDKLLQFFRVLPSDNKKTVVPAEVTTKDNKRKSVSLKPIDIPTSMQQMYNYFTDNMNIGIYHSNMYRMERYKDCKYAVTVEPILNSAVQIYVSESYDPKEGRKPILIKAKNSKIEKIFYEWLDSAGFSDNFMRDAIYNLVVYGDAFWVNNIDTEGTEGVKEVTALDPFLVANRLEFNVGIVNQMKQWSQTTLNMVNTFGSLRQIYDILNGDNLEDISQFYKSYLLGYELKFDAETGVDDKNVKGVPPWAITHCRMFTTENDFFPFGKPPLIYSLAIFKSYRTTSMLIDMLRASSFPREMVTIQGAENMDVYSRYNRVNEVREFLENVTPKTENRDDFAVGERIYAIDGFLDFDMIDPDVDLDKLGDLELKRQDLIQSTGVPDSYLNVSEGAGDLGGENAQALYYLNKIFQRRCESVKTALLEGIEETFRMHLMLTNQGDGDKEIFELSIPASTDQMNDEKMDHDKGVLDLISEIINSLTACAGLERGESLPQETVISIMRKYMPDSSEVEEWIKQIFKQAEENEKEQENTEEEEIEEEPVISKKKSYVVKEQKVIKEKLEKLTEEQVRNIYFESKLTKGLVSGTYGGRTYVNSSYKHRKDKYDSISLLKEEMNSIRMKRLEEKTKISE